MTWLLPFVFVVVFFTLQITRAEKRIEALEAEVEQLRTLVSK